MEVELPGGHVLVFPDDMPLEEVKKRAGHAKDFVGQFGRLPEKVTSTGASRGEPREGRKLEDVAREGLTLAKQVRGGQLEPDKLSDAEVLAVQIATRQMKPADLTAEQKATLGLSRGRLEEIRRGFEGGQPTTRTAEVGRAGRRAWEATKAGMTRPLEDFPVSGTVSKMLETPGEPEWVRVLKRIPAEALGLVERLPATALGAATAAAHEDPKQQEILGTLGQMAMLRGVPGTPRASTMSRRALVREQMPDLMKLRPEDPKALRPELVPPPTVEQLPSETGVRMRRTPQATRLTGQAPDAPELLEPRMLPAAAEAPGPRAMSGPTGFEILERARQTRSQLGGRVGAQLALPEAPREAAVRPFEEPARTVSSGGPQREPGLVEPRPPTPALPTAAEVAGRRAGLWPKPVEVSEILDPQGRPITREPQGPGPSGFEILEQAKKASVTGEVTPAQSRLAPTTEMTKMGEQGLLEGTPAREIPTTKTSSPVTQRALEESPLFQKPGPEQTSLVPPPGAEPPGGLRWNARPPGLRRLNAFASDDGRFLVEQRTPDQWVIYDKRGKDQATFPTFHDARRWAETKATSAMTPTGGSRTGRPVPTRESVNLRDPDSVFNWIKSEGGMKPSKDFPDVPFGLLNNQGLAYDELINALTTAGHGKTGAVERQLFRTLGRYQTLRAEKRKQGAKPPGAAYTPEEWNALPLEEQAKRMGLIDEEGRTRVGLLPGLGAAGAAAAALPWLASKGQGKPEEPRPGLRERLADVGKLALGAVPLVAGLMGGGRMGRGPRGEPIGAPGGTTAVPPPISAWRESLLPSPPKGPPTPPRPPMGQEPVMPGPYQGVPASTVTGTALRGVRDLGRQAFSTILGRMEQWGPAGQEIARLMQRVAGDTEMFYGRHVVPVVTELRGLSAAEKANFRQVAEGEAQPMNDRVRRVHDEVYLPVFGPQGVMPTEATRRGIMTRVFGEAELRPFEPRAHFFPHEFDPAFVREVLKPQSPARQRAIGQLMEREAVDADTAGVMLDDYFRASVTRQGQRIVYLEPDRFVGGLERARELNIDGYITDPEVALGLRGWKVARRFAEIDHYGYNDAVIGESSRVLGRPPTGPTKPAGLVGAIQAQHGPAEATKAFQLFKHVVGTPVEEQAMQTLARAVTSVEAFTKLPLAFVVNATQPTLTAFRTSLGATARGLLDAVTRPGASAEAAKQLGVIADMSIRELYAEMAGGYPNKLVDFVLRPFNIAEKWNRIVSANAGQVWARQLDGWIRTDARPGFVRRELDRLNFHREEVNEILQRRSLREGDHERIAWGIVDQTQFLARSARRSEFFYAHPVGQLVLQFKGFSTNTGRLMHQMLVQELRRGDPRVIANTVATLGVLFPLVGEMALDVRSLLRGRPRDTTIDEPVARVLENFLAVAGFGLATDFVETLTKGGRDAALSFLAGPALTDAARASYHVVKMGTSLGGAPGDFEKAATAAGRFAVRNVPFVGPRLSEALRHDRQAEARSQQTWQQQLGLDPIEARLRTIEAEDRQRKGEQARANRLAAEGRMDEARAVIDAWGALHQAPLALNPGSIRRQQERTRDPERARLHRLSPLARARMLRELDETGRTR